VKPARAETAPRRSDNLVLPLFLTFFKLCAHRFPAALRVRMIVLIFGYYTFQEGIGKRFFYLHIERIFPQRNKGENKEFL